MPAYGYQIETDDVWSIVHYVRALQRSQNATFQDLPKEEQEKRIEPLRKERDKKDEEIKKESIGEKKVKKEFGAGYYYPSRYAYASNNAYFETQVAIVRTTKKVEERERPVRKCNEEYKTNQFIGTDENKRTYYRY